MMFSYGEYNPECYMISRNSVTKIITCELGFVCFCFVFCLSEEDSLLTVLPKTLCATSVPQGSFKGEGESTRKKKWNYQSLKEVDANTAGLDHVALWLFIDS